jgi:hypothetical protein
MKFRDRGCSMTKCAESTCPGDAPLARSSDQRRMLRGHLMVHGRSRICEHYPSAKGETGMRPRCTRRTEVDGVSQEAEDVVVLFEVECGVPCRGGSEDRDDCSAAVSLPTAARWTLTRPNRQAESTRERNSHACVLWD